MPDPVPDLDRAGAGGGIDAAAMVDWGKMLKTGWKGYRWYRKGSKWYQIVRGVADRETRPGSIAKGAWTLVPDLLGTILGVPAAMIKYHPYYAFHKAHMEIVAAALNASDAFDRAYALLESFAASTRRLHPLSNDLAAIFRTKADELAGEKLFWESVNNSMRQGFLDHAAEVSDEAIEEFIGADERSRDEQYDKVCIVLAGLAVAAKLLADDVAASREAYASYREIGSRLGKSNIFGKVFKSKLDELEALESLKSRTTDFDKVFGYLGRNLARLDGCAYDLSGLAAFWEVGYGRQFANFMFGGTVKVKRQGARRGARD